MKTAKKIISMLLLAVMCVSFMGLTAFADGELLGVEAEGGELLGEVEEPKAAAENTEGLLGEEQKEEEKEENIGEEASMLKSMPILKSPFAPVETEADQASINGDFYTFENAFKAVMNGQTIKATKKETSQSVGSVTVTNNVVFDLNGEEIGGTITIGAGGALTIQNGSFNGTVENYGTLYVQAPSSRTHVAVVNNYAAGVTYKMDANSSIGEGAYEEKPIPSGDVSVSQPNGNSYYIFREGQGNSGLNYNTSPAGALTGIYFVYNGSNVPLTQGTHYSYDSASGAVTIYASAVSGSSDIVEVHFLFGKTECSKAFKIYMFPDNNISESTFTKGYKFGTIKYAFNNNAKGGYKYSSGSGYKQLATNAYTFNGGLVLSNDFLNSLEVGTYTFYYVYSDGMFLALNDTLTVSEDTGNITVTQKVNAEWKSGDGDKVFVVSREPISAIKIDGISINNNLWYDSEYYNYIYIGKALMAELDPGVHTLEVYGGSYFAYGKTTFRVAATLKPVTTDKHVTGNGSNLAFVCSEPIAKVFVGDIELDNNWYDYYKLSTDGKTVTLKAKFLNNKLVAGTTYTLTVVTRSGSEPSCTFKILTTAQASSSPKTGDTSNLGLWCAAMAVAATAAVVLMPKLKKDENA